MTEAPAAAKRSDVFRKWSKLFEEEASAREAAAVASKKRRELEKQFPFLGSIKGMIRRTEKEEKKEEKGEAEEPERKRKRPNKEDFSETQRELHRKYSALLNKITQLRKQGKRPRDDDVKALAAAAVGKSTTIPDGLLLGLINDGFSDQLSSEGYPVPIGN